MPAQFNILREAIAQYNRELENLREEDIDVKNATQILIEIRKCFNLSDDISIRHQKRMEVLKRYYETPYQPIFELALSDYNKRCGCFFEALEDKDCAFCGCNECHETNLKKYVNYMNTPTIERRR